MYRPSRWMGPFLALPGGLWALGISARNRLYESGMLAVHSLGRPVISIGNVTLGGTGKTPLVIHVARLTQRCGRTPVVLSRGYRRSSPARTIIAGPQTAVGGAAA